MVEAKGHVESYSLTLMDNQRLPRLLELVTILQSGVGTQLYEIMDELDISRSTAFRDLKVLRDAGIPYNFEQGKGYQVNSTFFLPPVNLQTSEARALVMLIKCAASHLDGQVSCDAIRALRKLTCSLSVPVRDVCRGLLDQVTVHSSPAELADRQTDHVSNLLHAIQDRLCVEATLNSEDGSARQVRMHPHHLICAECRWLLVATLHPGHVMRTIRLDQLTQLRVTTTTFRHNGFDLQGYLGKAWRWQPEGTIYQVVLQVDADEAATFTSVQWHPTQTYRMGCDGQCELSFEVDGLNEIADWIWLHHSAISIEQPEELKQIIRLRCQAVLERLQAKAQ